MTSLVTTVQNNEVEGDLAGRDVNKTYYGAREPTAMARLVEQFLAETRADQTLNAWTEKLEHYMSNTVNSDVRGLEEKLSASGRNDLLNKALRYKQNAYKAILRQQGSKSAQTIYTFLMAAIVTNFDLVVQPLVQAGEPRPVVDMATLEKVIEPAFRLLESNPLDLDLMDIQGLVYFLAGNCYIRWDPC
jgi:hypothetical protein